MNIKIGYIFIFLFTSTLYSYEYTTHFYDKKKDIFSKLNSWNDSIRFNELYFEVKDYNELINRIVDYKFNDNENYNNNSFFKIENTKLNVIKEYCKKKNNRLLIKVNTIEQFNHQFQNINFNISEDLFVYYLYRIFESQSFIKNYLIENFNLNKIAFKTELNNLNNYRYLINKDLKKGETLVIKTNNVDDIYLSINGENRNIFYSLQNIGDSFYLYQASKDIRVSQIYIHTESDLIKYSYLILKDKESFISENISYKYIDCSSISEHKDSSFFVEDKFLLNTLLKKSEFETWISDKNIFRKVLFNNSVNFENFNSTGFGKKKYLIKFDKYVDFNNHIHDIFNKLKLEKIILLYD